MFCTPRHQTSVKENGSTTYKDHWFKMNALRLRVHKNCYTHIYTVTRTHAYTHTHTLHGDEQRHTSKAIVDADDENNDDESHETEAASRAS
eukprot:6461245-Amphidinium_carterae.1